MRVARSVKTVSVVIPNRNRAALLARALRSVLAQELPENVLLEVVVVDNGSGDGSVALSRDLGARTILLGANRGVSVALNRGITSSTGRWIVLLNNDVELAPDWLVRMLRGAERDGVWFATGKVLDALRPGLVDGAGDGVCRGGAAWRLGHGRPDGPGLAHARTVRFPSATASLFRREFFDRVGLFDEAFFAYLEDVELGLRAAAHGLRGVYVPRARCWHRGSATVGAWSGPMVAWITRHRLLLLARHYSPGMLLEFGHEIAAVQLLWAAMAVRRGRAGAWLRGAWCGMADFVQHRRDGRGTAARRLAAALCESEVEIRALQRSGTPDRFWKWYFRLARPLGGGDR